VLNLVLSEHPWPWRIDEIARELDNEADAEDAVCRLTASGLLHRVGEFVFPTRTASRAAEIEVGTAWSSVELQCRVARTGRGAAIAKDRATTKDLT
jgi:hypothetical protein